jgi:hypothetical protein
MGDTALGQKTLGGKHIVAINLGWDFTAEHEWGITRILEKFGVPGTPTRGDKATGHKDLIGADVRTVTKVPEGFKLFIRTKAVYLVYSIYFNQNFMPDRTQKNTPARELDRMMEIYRHTADVCAAWGGSEFAVRLVKRPGQVPTSLRMLKDLFDAFERKDGMIFLSQSPNPYGRAGLVLAIRSRMPKEQLDALAESDKKFLDFNDVVSTVEAKTGLRELLAAKEKRFLVLNPFEASGFKPVGRASFLTKYPIIYWLNPADQKQNNFGWFTVEELLEWAEGRGPIPKSLSGI